MTKPISEPQPARAAAYVALYPLLLQVAKDHGYALTLHGSIHRDFDLVAVPWVENARDHHYLVLAMEKAVGGKVLVARTLPHGRLAYSIHLTKETGDDAPYIDLSVMPRVAP